MAWTNTPKILSAGDAITWSFPAESFPAADGYTVKFVAVGVGAKIELTAAEQSGEWVFTADGVTTASYAAGSYKWAVYATKAGARETIEVGFLQVSADLDALATLDTRTPWQIIIENLEAALKAMAAGEIKITQVQLSGRMVTFRSLSEIMEALSMARVERERERARDRLAKGLPGNTTIGIRF